MVRDPFARRESPALESVLEALDDPDCRDILSALEEPMTAREISDRCDIPLSTTYRKLEKLTDATLLDEHTEIRRDGRHTTRYRIHFREVLVALTENRRLDLSVSRPPRPPEDRLADLWSEVRKGV